LSEEDKTNKENQRGTPADEDGSIRIKQKMDLCRVAFTKYIEKRKLCVLMTQIKTQWCCFYMLVYVRSILLPRTPFLIFFELYNVQKARQKTL